TPELAPWVLERLFEAGAADVWFTPIHMKKGRPGITLSVLCSRGTDGAVRELLWRETSTLGVRGLPVRKWMLERRVIAVSGPGGPRTRVERLGRAHRGGARAGGPQVDAGATGDRGLGARRAREGPGQAGPGRRPGGQRRPRVRRLPPPGLGPPPAPQRRGGPRPRGR